MNNQTKKVLVIGLITVGTGVVLCNTKGHKEQRKAIRNRKEIERFIAKHTSNNQKLITAVKNLSDKQVANLVAMIKQLKKMHKKVYVEGANIKDLTRTIINQVANQL